MSKGEVEEHVAKDQVKRVLIAPTKNFTLYRLEIFSEGTVDQAFEHLGLSPPFF